MQIRGKTCFVPKLLYQILLVVVVVVILMNNIPHAKSLSFSFPNFTGTEPNMNLTHDSYVEPFSGTIQLTKNDRSSFINGSVGRASYSKPVPLWVASNGTKDVASFTTHFRFIIEIDDQNKDNTGDGMAFFLAPFQPSASPPPDSAGGCLGLVSDVANHSGLCNIPVNYTFVAVEFDTYNNTWDPIQDHIGIDVNSVVSSANISLNSTLKTSNIANAWISYNSSTHNLSVFLTYAQNPVFNGNSTLSYSIDLAALLPENVRVGFSASTGDSVEIHKILSWDFSSTLLDPHKTKGKAGLVAAIVAAVTVFILGLGWLSIMWRKRRSRRQLNDGMDFGVDDDFEDGTGPRKFTFGQLSRATNNFAEEGKLGEGGFGGVYKGLLTDPNREIAVKKISRESKQGKKEYVSEVKIISRLRHRNLVQLLGWCHDQGRLLLVYEFMPNGSLDSHLYGGKKDSLPWTIRYKIAHGLASALLYLHEEWEQCVLHRDIKSSNVMLDANFNANLGDFGLARLVDHQLGSQTTVLAGTLGFLAPECVITGKATKESDVYSFGMVGLEIACGRRPIEPMEEPGKVRMVEWVWDLYGKGRLFQAADTRLEEGFDAQQMECLMVVALWCCHPDYTLRPSIRQVLNVLNLEAPLPNLPLKFPFPVYLSSPLQMNVLSFASSFELTRSSGTASSSSKSTISGTAPLLSQT